MLWFLSTLLLFYIFTHIHQPESMFDRIGLMSVKRNKSKWAQEHLSEKKPTTFATNEEISSIIQWQNEIWKRIAIFERSFIVKPRLQEELPVGLFGESAKTDHRNFDKKFAMFGMSNQSRH